MCLIAPWDWYRQDYVSKVMGRGSTGISRGSACLIMGFALGVRVVMISL